MKQQLCLVGLVLAILAVAPACFATSFSDPLGNATAGINGSIYLDTQVGIIEVHGGQVVNTIPLAYGGATDSYDEAAIGIINGYVVTHNASSGFPSGPTGGGQYALNGTPTGVASYFYNDPSYQYMQMGNATGGSLATDGTNVYFLAHGLFASLQMFESNSDFSDPTPIFTPALSSYYDSQVAYDPNNNSLLVDDAGNTVYDYSLSGNVMSSFQIYNGGGSGAIMTFDPTDGTLWFGSPFSGANYFMEQYSMSGQLLQSGDINLGITPDNIFAMASTDYSPATPEPGTLLLLGTGLAGAARWLRRRKAA